VVELVASIYLLYIDVNATKTNRKIKIHKNNKGFFFLTWGYKAIKTWVWYDKKRKIKSLISQNYPHSPARNNNIQIGFLIIFWNKHFHLYISWLPPKWPQSARCMACKSFLPLLMLYSHSVDCFICCAETFNLMCQSHDTLYRNPKDSTKKNC